MSDMKIYKEMLIDAPLERVWSLVGTEAGLRQWWHAEISLEPERGGLVEERGIRNGRPYRLVGTITTYAALTHLALTLHARDGGAWPPSTRIDITLNEIKSKAQPATHVVVEQRALIAEPPIASEPLDVRSLGQQPHAHLPQPQLALPILPTDAARHAAQHDLLNPLMQWREQARERWERALSVLKQLAD